MNIALVGYGKMGREIEKIAIERGHEIVIKIDQDNSSDFSLNTFKSSDVAIEFSQPESAVANYKQCFLNNIPVVSGTTGWLESYSKIVEFCKKEKQAFFYASNFSLGVNVFFEINKKLAELMNRVGGYDVRLEEIHHTQKLDAPSGTAITIAEQIIKNFDKKTTWALDKEEPQVLNIVAKRIAETPGTHTVKYESDIDEISIEHKAKSRKGFALGAVLAAEFLVDKKGVFGMSDLLKL